MMLALETSDRLAENAASSLIHIGKVRELDEITKGIDSVSADDVQRVAKDILQTSGLNLALIGPHANKEKLLKLLKL